MEQKSVVARLAQGGKTHSNIAILQEFWEGVWSKAKTPFADAPYIFGFAPKEENPRVMPLLW